LDRQRLWIFISAVLLLGLLAGCGLVHAEDAAGAIALAKQQIALCYQATAEAERVGGNVTSLENALNDDGVLLSKAELVYSAGDFGAAGRYATQCSNSLNEVMDEAARIKTAGESARTMDFLVNIGSTVGTFVVIGAAAGVWFYLKRRYGEVETEEQVVAVARI
jgi:hypothetical protein